ncbi:MFS general substrate transporter [Pseudovirgaria hyperparasitica]|uniref:MFS general substrate transporter n=1 Tax=Pseudovirgaria hyperparasitica TaxID=470096 RepID=A0A6A6W5R2_9PEZI|nr:MFS general substrate transporter [Pseudovirgaria hyperparasitica]KAF2757280.1 MFS general substrate transporter [Pseudovirgaria hyperparasitica]
MDETMKPMADERVENAKSDIYDEGLISTAEEQRLTKRLLWKMDSRILPILALLFLCSFIDRTNVGNVKILGLQASLRITDHQFAIGLCAFYATYILSEIPSNLLLRTISPRIWLPLLTAVWGTLTMCLGFTTNFASFVAVRALLGFVEGGLLPGMILYLTAFYTRTELAVRIGIFYTAASLSGAFGGLLARGLSAIGPAGGLEGWRWVLVIEGLLTVACGLICSIFLPNSISSARFLSPAQKDLALSRLHSSAHATEHFAWSEVRRGILNVQVWLSASSYFAILSGLYSFGLFLPTIINSLSFVHDANAAQLWSVIPYAVAAFFTVCTALLSDRLRLRGVIMLFTLPIAIIGYGVISRSTNAKVQYGMTFLMATGLYSSVPCVLVWNSNNSAGHYKRATTSGLQLAVANAGGFVASFIYPGKEKPTFTRSHEIILGLLCASWLLVAANVAWCAKINRDKRRGRYAEFEGSGDDRDPEFKMVL